MTTSSLDDMLETLPPLEGEPAPDAGDAGPVESPRRRFALTPRRAFALLAIVLALVSRRVFATNARA